MCWNGGKGRVGDGASCLKAPDPGSGPPSPGQACWQGEPPLLRVCGGGALPFAGILSPMIMRKLSPRRLPAAPSTVWGLSLYISPLPALQLPPAGPGLEPRLTLVQRLAASRWESSGPGLLTLSHGAGFSIHLGSSEPFVPQASVLTRGFCFRLPMIQDAHLGTCLVV